LLISQKAVPEVCLRAVQIHAHGGVDQLRFETTRDPELTSDQDVLVKLRAAAVNSNDISVRKGLTRVKVHFPHILGSDGAGIVVATGTRVGNVKAGDAVSLYPAVGCGTCQFCVTDREYLCAGLNLMGERESGTYAEYVRVQARNCFLVPAEFSFEEAAALPLAFITVWRMLLTNAELKPGESVLIRGIRDEFATAALQLSVSMCSDVIVTDKEEDQLATAKELGAKHVIDERYVDLSKEVRRLTGKRGVDVVVDCVGGKGWIESLAALAKGGRLVTCGASAGANPQTDVRRIFWNYLKVFGSTLGTREDFTRVLNFLKLSRSKPLIDEVFSLKDARQAQQRLSEGKHLGKIILRMDA
jgi:NADPH:quinone reductase-like Zn-dependent oxidoreductase